MVQRSLTVATRLAGWLLASVVVLLALVVWRLAAGPLPLDFATPYIERALSAADRGISTEVGSTQLRLQQDRGLALVALGVVAREPDGDVLVDLPEVGIGLSLRALLLHQTLAPSHLRVRSPEVVLTRRVDGSIGLRSTGSDAAPLDLKVLAGPVLAAPDPAEPLSFLELVAVEGARVTLADARSGRSVRARDGRLSIVRSGRELAAEASVALDAGERAPMLSGLLRLDPERDEVEGAVELSAFRPTELARLRDFLPGPVARDLDALPLEGADLRFHARIGLRADLSGRLRNLRFALDSDGGRLTWPEQLERPLEVDRFSASGRVAPDLATVEVEQLELSVQGATVTGAGELGFGAEGFRLAAEIRARDVEVAALGALWPVRAADEARAWVTENITAGRAGEGALTIDLRAADLGQRPLRKDALRGFFTYDDLTIRYFEALPPVAGVDGRATFDAQTMTFQATGGRIGKLEAQTASVVITGIGIKGRDTTQLEVETTIEGPFADALALIDHPPFGFASELGLDPGSARGASRTELRIGLPLHREVSEDEVRVAADATLAAVAVDDLFGRVDVGDGAFDLEVSRAAMTVVGRGLVEGVPVEVRWEEVFGGGPFDRRLELEGTIDRAALAAFGVEELPFIFEGAARAGVEVVETEGRREIEAALDLASARLALAVLGWKKPLGDPGTLEVALRLEDGAPIRVERFDLDAPGLAAAGSATFDLVPFAFRTAEIRRFEHGEQRLAATVGRSPEGALDVALDARRLDLRPFLGGAEDDPAADEEAGAAPPPLVLNVTAREVIVSADGGRLRDLQGRLERDRRGWREGTLEALLPNGAPVRLKLEPVAGVRRLVLTSDDGGELLQTFQRDQRIEGGRFRLEADLAAQVPALEASGRLTVEDFTLIDAPLLARLLTVASLTGIGNLLQGDGIFMDRLDLPFTYAGEVLTLDRGRLSGSQLGLTAEGEVDFAAERLDLKGTIVPVYALNRAIGRIPVIGDFLAGSEGVGAFAATYSVSGPIDAPDVSVNPLSALAPGFIRELFVGMRDGTLEAPDLPEDRD